MLCSWARHLTLKVPLSTQEYKWVPANCWGKPNKLRGNNLRLTSIPSRGSRNTPSRFMLQKPAIHCKLQRYGSVGSKASFYSSSLVTLLFSLYSTWEHLDWLIDWFAGRKLISYYFFEFSIFFVFFVSHQASLHLFPRCLMHQNYLMNWKMSAKLHSLRS